MEKKKTHRLVEKPQMPARSLAAYMEASERKKRSIVADCKYPRIPQVAYYREANAILANFILSENPDPEVLHEKSQMLRDKWTDEQTERDRLDHNADYLTRFSEVHHLLDIKGAELLPSEKTSVDMNGVKVTSDTRFRLRRLTQKNTMKVGAGSLRYSKGTPLTPEEAEWQSAFTYGHLLGLNTANDDTPEFGLCLTLDVYAGKLYPAPTNSLSRYKNMQAACQSISERWDKVPPPKNAKF